ncbi:hypothetical protein FCN77_07340 [Arthrobacter sp. 24S4-2]|uniref:hypothetical protein n=1 Tax=Arthrobacter sp. 24S4-2 TaxID=2575374 RepID=UPI0010C79981|nr:hypothetical protein [Arthrobacter sp. 24S4-2]QCO97560.1 hypothetical protein FCN77_07340 [Arthrobacter sp. 24S4-2]
MKTREEGADWKIAPSTRLGWWALWLAAAVVFYPLYWSILLILPSAAGPYVGVVLAVLAIAAVSAGCIAIFPRRDRSGLLLAALILLVVSAIFFIGGEFLFPH